MSIKNLSLIVLLSITGTAFADDANINDSRPFRAGFMKMSPYMDTLKPLAVADSAGWVRNQDVLVGSYDDNWIGAYSLATKSNVWWKKYESDLTSPPGSFGSWVVMGMRDGTLAKIEATTGKEVWSANLDSFVQRGMTLNGTTLYVVTAAQVLYAIDFQSGKTLWIFDAGFPDGMNIQGAAKPIFYDNSILFGVTNGEVLSVNASTGKLRWRYNPYYTDARFHDVVGEMVILKSNLLLTRYDGLIASIDLESSTRKVVWQEKLPNIATSAFRNNRYYVGALNGDIYAFDAVTGKRVWRVVTGTALSTITAGETAIFVTGSNGAVFAIDANLGVIKWHDDLGGAILSQPVLGEDHLYIATGIRNIYKYRLR